MSESAVAGNLGLIWESPNSWVLANSDDSDKSAGKKAVADATTPDSPTAATKKINEDVAPNPLKKKRGKKMACGDDLKRELGGGELDHELHIWTERERRKKMRNMFSNLHALLPQLPPKADKSTIVDEAVSYIRSLENTLQNLQKQKLERLYDMNTVVKNKCKNVDFSSREAFLADQTSCNNNLIASNSLPQFAAAAVVFQTWTSPNVILNVCGEDAHISICSAKRPGLLTAIFYVLERHRLEVVSAQVSSESGRSMYMIQAHANPSNQLAVEEIYKQAAAEIMLWV